MKVRAPIFGLGAHSDDLAFSLGAALWDRRLPGIRPVTVFSWSGYTLASPDGDPDTVSGMRKMEDLRFFSSAGTGLPIWLDMPDAPLRRPFSPMTLFTAPLLAEELDDVHRRLLSAIPGSGTLLAPLALGSHLDHRIVHGAACRLYAEGRYDLIFYEDLPYAAFMQSPAIAAHVQDLERRLRGILRPHLWPSAELVRVKQRVVESYPSQCDEGTLGALLFHAQRLRPSLTPVERVWVPVKSGVRSAVAL